MGLGAVAASRDDEEAKKMEAGDDTVGQKLDAGALFVLQSKGKFHFARRFLLSLRSSLCCTGRPSCKRYHNRVCVSCALARITVRANSLTPFYILPKKKYATWPWFNRM